MKKKERIVLPYQKRREMRKHKRQFFNNVTELSGLYRAWFACKGQMFSYTYKVK